MSTLAGGWTARPNWIIQLFRIQKHIFLGGWTARANSVKKIVVSKSQTSLFRRALWGLRRSPIYVYSHMHTVCIFMYVYMYICILRRRPLAPCQPASSGGRSCRDSLSPQAAANRVATIRRVYSRKALGSGSVVSPRERCGSP